MNFSRWIHFTIASVSRCKIKRSITSISVSLSAKSFRKCGSYLSWMLCTAVRFYGFTINSEPSAHTLLKGPESDSGRDLLTCSADCIRFDPWCSVFKMFEFLLTYQLPEKTLLMLVTRKRRKRDIDKPKNPNVCVEEGRGNILRNMRVKSFTWRHG